MTFTLNFYEFLHKMYTYVLNYFVKISMMFAKYFEYYIIILRGGGVCGHAVYDGLNPYINFFLK